MLKERPTIAASSEILHLRLGSLRIALMIWETSRRAVRELSDEPRSAPHAASLVTSFMRCIR